MVTMTTLVAGISCLILLVASRPSITGILTSIRTRSGSSSLQEERASCPFLASATTLISSSPESMVLRPSLTRAWSSAIRSRAGSVCVAFSSTFLPPLTVCEYRRYLRHHFGTFAQGAADFQAAAQQGHPLSHAGEPEAFAGSAPVGGLLRVEARSPVAHPEVDGVVQVPKRDLYAGRRGVLADVGQGLLRDPEERGFDLGWQALVSQRFLVVDLAAFVADLLHLQPDRGAEPEVVERRGPEVGYYVAGFPDRLLHELQDAREVLAAFFGVRGVPAGDGLHELVGGGGRLGEAVVHLVGDLAALLLLGS